MKEFAVIEMFDKEPGWILHRSTNDLEFNGSRSQSKFQPHEYFFKAKKIQNPKVFIKRHCEKKEPFVTKGFLVTVRVICARKL